MINRKIIYFLVIVHILPPGNKASGHRFLSKLVNQTRPSNSQNVEKTHTPIEGDVKCKYKCIVAANELAPRLQARNKARFIDLGGNDTIDSSEMEAPSNKYSIFNLLTEEEGEEGEEGDGEEVEKKTKRQEEDDEEEEEDEDEDEEGEGKDEDYDDDGKDEDIGFGFLSPEEEIQLDKLKGTEGEALLKQYHRQRLRMHNLLFPLLLAYKLKFFTVIPLLLGSLVLLIGSTGVAGFFFALFAAALGIHVKGQQQ